MNLRNVLHSVLIHLFSRYESHEIISSNTSNTPVKGMMLRAGQLRSCPSVTRPGMQKANGTIFNESHSLNSLPIPRSRRHKSQMG